MALVPFPGPQSRAFDSPLEEDDDASSSKMSFLEHLDELRKRIINSCIAIAVCVLLGFGFIDRIFNFVFAPTRQALPPGVKLIYTQPGEAFSLYIEIALIIGVMLAAPFIMAFFASFNTPDLAFMPKLEEVFGLYSKLLIGMGIVFQMPTVVFFLAKMKVLTARFLIGNFKYALLLIFIVAAVITPTGDMMTQLIFAAPMLGLYLLSIVIAWVVGPKRQKVA